MEVLLSAMYLKDWEYINSLNITSDTVIINQCDRVENKCIDNGNQKITYCCTKDRGLSKSRNMAIRMATSEICILCDNDVEYIQNYEKIIESKFDEYPDADMIVFFIKRDVNSIPYTNIDVKMNHKLAFKVFSPEIAFKKSVLEKNDLYFNEDFGAGSKYMSGEENIFLIEALRKKLNVIYTPTHIASLRFEESTWKSEGRNKKFFYDKGALYYALSPKYSIFLDIQFVIRKRKLYDMSMIKAFHYMIKGESEYKKDRRKK